MLLRVDVNLHSHKEVTKWFKYRTSKSGHRDLTAAKLSADRLNRVNLVSVISVFSQVLKQVLSDITDLKVARATLLS